MKRYVATVACCFLIGALVRADEPFPAKVHVFEDFETEIEKRWWMRGVEELKDVAPSLSSIPNTRAMRAAATKDFDRKMGDQSKDYKAVIFNPVPGPPMGPATRLSFRYKLSGSDSMRVQIYSLSNNYHRKLELDGLPQDSWQHKVVDMTTLRRPDGSGGPLSEDERIDDIQFYIDPKAELLIDDIVLFDAGAEDSAEKFPRRIIFTGWFDTGKQGDEWPGDFEIVLHEKPRTWDAVKAIPMPGREQKWIRVGLWGRRSLGEAANLKFKYKSSGEGALAVVLANRSGDDVNVIGEQSIEIEKPGEWSASELKFRDGLAPISEIQIIAPDGVDLLVDDLLLYEPVR